MLVIFILHTFENKILFNCLYLNYYEAHKIRNHCWRRIQFPSDYLYIYLYFYEVLVLYGLSKKYELMFFLGSVFLLLPKENCHLMAFNDSTQTSYVILSQLYHNFIPFKINFYY